MVTNKKLAQSALSSTVSILCSGIADKTVEAHAIYFCNTSTTDRTVTTYAHGSADANMIMTLEVESGGFVAIPKDEFIVVLGSTSESLYAKQDTGTDITCTVYGLEES